MASKFFVRAKCDQIYNEDDHGLDLELLAKKKVEVSKEEYKLLKEKYSYLEFSEE